MNTLNTTKQLQLVTYDQAKRLKVAGFYWKCDFLYVGGVLTKAGSDEFQLA